MSGAWKVLDDCISSVPLKLSFDQLDATTVSGISLEEMAGNNALC